MDSCVIVSFVGIRQNFKNNWDKEGAAFAVCQNGKMVVDIWGGFADTSARWKWREDTMTVAYSSTKVSKMLLRVTVKNVIVYEGYLCAIFGHAS